MKKILKIILINLILAFTLIEIGTRLFFNDGYNLIIEMTKYAKTLKVVSKDPSIGIEHQKNKSENLMNVEIKLNNIGTRNNYDYENKKSILMIGDSMTLGWGASKTFSDYIYEKYNKNINVYNSGIGNTNTIMQINLFLKKNKNIKPEIIILNFFVNDFEKVEIKNTNFIIQNLYFLSIIYDLYNTALIKLGLKKDWKDFYLDTLKNKEIINETQKKIRELKKYCDNNSITLIINNIPSLTQLNQYPFFKISNLIKKFSKDNNIIFIDSLEDLQKYKNNESKLWVSYKDHHANNYAHKLIASFMEKKIGHILNDKLLY